jgi:hypothetical protein
MHDDLRELCVALLTMQSVGVLCPRGGAWAMPVQFRTHGLHIDCLLPHWPEVVSDLESCPHVRLIGRASPSNRDCWPHYLATVRSISTPDWTQHVPDSISAVLLEHRYLVVRLRVQRVDLIDQRRVEHETQQL